MVPEPPPAAELPVVPEPPLAAELLSAGPEPPPAVKPGLVETAPARHPGPVHGSKLPALVPGPSLGSTLDVIRISRRAIAWRRCIGPPS